MFRFYFILTTTTNTTSPGLSPEKRQAYAAQIAERNNMLFERRATISEWERFLDDAANDRSIRRFLHDPVVYDKWLREKEQEELITKGVTKNIYV